VGGNRKLQRIYEKWIKEEAFEPIRSTKITLTFSSVQLGDSAWADCRQMGHNHYKIRVHSSLKLMDAPDYVLSYLVNHELIHTLPGCWNHNDNFWTHEKEMNGENYYEANTWLKQHTHLLSREYSYRQESWLRRQINDQMRIKDMAAICGCSESTIKRYLKKYKITIDYR